jgi:hypothetical protein
MMYLAVHSGAEHRDESTLGGPGVTLKGFGLREGWCFRDWSDCREP